MKRKKARDVMICEIAKSLPVDKWFDKRKFSDLTGIAMVSCNQRLRTLANEGYLLRKDVLGKLFFKMPIEGKLAMISKGKRHKVEVKRKNKSFNQSRIEDIRAAEILAYRDGCYRHLVDVRFL